MTPADLGAAAGAEESGSRPRSRERANPWERLENLPGGQPGLLVECLRDLDERLARLEAEHPLVVAEPEIEPSGGEPWGRP